VYDGDSGAVIGDAESTVNSIEDVTYGADKVEAVASFYAKLKVPAGTQGEGYAYHAVDLHALAAPTASIGGQKYFLAADANGLIQLGVRKTSDAGEESAEAKIAGIAGADNAVTNYLTCPDCRNNLIYGSAEVSAKTKSTGTGGTYAIVGPLDNSAAYADYTAYPVCTDCQVKYTEGEVYSNIELDTCNRECIDCCEDCDVGAVAPGGTKTAEAKAFTKSQANNFKSSSSSSATVTANAKRTTKGTSRAFGELTNIYIWSGAKDNTVYDIGWNAETQIVGSGTLEAEGRAYAPKDSTTASASMTAQADTDNNANTNKATAKAEAVTTVYRADLNNYLRAFSGAELDDISFYANAADLRSSQKYANVNGYLDETSAEGYLLKKDIRDGVGIKSQITKELTATRSGTTAKSTITDKVTNKGPVSGNANDEAEVEQAADLHASARANTKNTYVDIVGSVTSSDIFGNNAVGTGSTNLPAVTTGKNLAIDTFTTSSTHNTWTMSFGASSS